jgi:hypothetical protein
MAGIVLASGTVSLEMSDDLRRYVDKMLNQVVPTLRPAMDRLIREALEEVKAEWPDEPDRRAYEASKRKAVAQAAQARRDGRKAGKRIKGISFWDYMPSQYPPKGYRATGTSKAGWKVEIRLLAGPMLDAVLFNTATKGGSRYPYMAKNPPPSSNKTYFKTIAMPAITDREAELIETFSADLGRLAGAD